MAEERVKSRRIRQDFFCRALFLSGLNLTQAARCCMQCAIRPAYEDIKPQTERMAPEKYDQILSRMICLSHMILRAK